MESSAVIIAPVCFRVMMTMIRWKTSFSPPSSLDSLIRRWKPTETQKNLIFNLIATGTSGNSVVNKWLHDFLITTALFFFSHWSVHVSFLTAFFLLVTCSYTLSRILQFWALQVRIWKWNVTLCVRLMTAVMKTTVVSSLKRDVLVVIKLYEAYKEHLTTVKQKLHIWNSPIYHFCFFLSKPTWKSSFRVFACQGYSGKGFTCDFEDAGMCGWTDASLNAPVYSWERRQRGQTLPDSGPSSDYTTGTATGIVDPLSFCIFFGLPDQSLLNILWQYANILFDLF